MLRYNAKNNTRMTHPRYHETVTVPISSRPGGMRVVLTQDGIIRPLVQFFEVPRNTNKSPAWQQKVAHAVGLLYDYFQAVPFLLDPHKSAAYLSDFIAKLSSGTIRRDGTDETGLYWSATGWPTVSEVLRYVNAFSDFCSSEYGTQPLNPVVKASFAQRIATYRHLDLRNEYSLLKHLGNAKAFWRDAQWARAVSVPLQPKTSERRPPFYPREHVAKLLDQGFRRRISGRLWEKYDIQSIMLVMLERYGGLRVSEPFHIFVTDVFEYPRCPGYAEVRLYNPDDGRFSYRDQLTGKIVHVQRREFLKMQYGLLPRSEITGKLRAGWKRLMLDCGAPQNYAVVQWFPREAAKDFWILYKAYIRHVLPSGLPHPYLFANLHKGPEYGTPHKLSSYHKKLESAIRRIGLEPKKILGTTSHGFRHAYAQDLKDADVHAKIIQICLHHKSILSQRQYTRPTVSQIHEALHKGWERLKAGSIGPCLLSSSLDAYEEGE